MRVQDLSYTPLNETVVFPEYRARMEVFSNENLYAVAPGSFRKAEDGSFLSNDLVWGESEHVDGAVSLSYLDHGNARSFFLASRLDEGIRAVKLRLDGLRKGTLVSTIDGEREIGKDGLLLHYPEGWRSLSYPLILIRLYEGGFFYAFIKNVELHQAHFLLKEESEGTRLDIVVEEIASKMGPEFKLPEIEIGFAASKEEAVTEIAAYTEKAYGLRKFEDSPIVPSWLPDVDLVATVHMEAFTGKIFHTYASALEDVRKLASLIDGRRLLVYLPGWEGRYYYKYGDYTPDDRLGGKEGLRKLVDGIHGLGAHVIAMYGMNMADRRIPSVDALSEDSEFVSPSGSRFHHGSVDWEGAHHYDFGGLAQLNIARKKWQDYLFRQIERASREFGFDGAFLDIAACYVNDRRSELTDGVRAFADRLRGIKKDFLVSGEGFYDKLAAAMPLFQSGHTDGILHYHDQVSERLFTPYAREFAHLCLGDIAGGSTGVHEQGTSPCRSTPLRKGIIPTVSLVDGSIEKAPEALRAIVAQADEYRRIKRE